jgi:moderate conductance mechanosensitive channel
VDEATHVMQAAVEAMAADEQWRDDLMEAPQILGVEHLTVDGATIRATVKTTTDAQPRVTRELRLRLTEALAIAGITGAISANRVYVRPPSEPPTGATASGG